MHYFDNASTTFPKPESVYNLMKLLENMEPIPEGAVTS